MSTVAFKQPAPDRTRNTTRENKNLRPVEDEECDLEEGEEGKDIEELEARGELEEGGKQKEGRELEEGGELEEGVKPELGVVGGGGEDFRALGEKELLKH